jgi:hypothetical protein
MSYHPFSSAPSPAERLLPLLQGVRRSGKGWTARCPAHDDAHASLSVRATDGGALLVKCHAGCSAAAVVAAVGLELRDLFPAPEPPRRLAATYDYRDADGRLLFQVVRFEPKDFRQRRPDGRGGWVWKLGDVPRVLYRLPELNAAPADQPVFVVEGEKDADRLAALGLVATTNVGGAGKWRAEHGRCLAGRAVVVLPDNDAPGRDHARQVVRLTLDHAASVRVLGLPGLPPHGDVSDWLAVGQASSLPGDGQAGSLPHGAAALRRLAEAAPAGADWLAAADPEPADAALLTTLADVAPRPLEWLWPGRLARGKLAIIDGDPGLGKSLVTLDLCARLTRGRPFPDGTPAPVGSVVIVNCEDGVADTIRPRLDALGADLGRVHLFRGRVEAGFEQLPSFPRDLARLERAIREVGAVLVVIDPIMVFFDETVCTGNDQSVRQALAPLARLAEETGCVILLVRHLNKTGGGKAVYRGGGSIGIVGACRSAWLIARHPGEPRQRVLAAVKNNLAAPPASLAYEVLADADGRPQVAWLGEAPLTADDLLGGRAADDDPGPRERAAELLRAALRDGPRPAEEVIAELARQGVSRRTAFRAKDLAGVQTAKERTPSGGRVWRLGEAGPADPPPRGPYRRSPDDGPYHQGD